MRKILIAAGGSGGHLFPSQQLASMLQRRGEWEVLFAGHGLSGSSFFEKERVGFVEIPAAKIGSLAFFPRLFKGLIRGIRELKKFNPDVVVGFGSYHTFPILLAAALLGKKLVLFEANCAFGKVNRFFSPFAEWTAVQFPIRGKKLQLIPLLPWIVPQDIDAKDKIAARRAFGLMEDRLTILVFGGSQGAKFLNAEIPKALAQYGAPIQVLHFTGKDEGDVAEQYRTAGILAYVRPFEPKMALAYGAADSAICRSGASTVAELIRYQMPALLIPFPEASEDHQRKNGEYLLSASAARLVIQKQANGQRLLEEIKRLVQDRELIQLSLQKISLHASHRRDFAELVGGIFS
jgi:UDP-N-acetylglucosamine--N-acetylmuramyl-(pentapeptide) pyrophosphoryl-undecaprenol N-acetylglucosamine transferase